MKKYRIKKLLLLVLILGCQCLVACSNDNNQIKQAKAFIETQLSVDLYNHKDTDERLEEALKSYFTEEAYNTYLENHFIYMYGELYAQNNVQQVKLKKIKCKETIKLDDTTRTYTFEVKYTINKGSKTEELVDYISITMNGDNQFTEALIKNTSDVVKKLYFNIKIQ